MLYHSTKELRTGTRTFWEMFTRHSKANSKDVILSGLVGYSDEKSISLPQGFLRSNLHLVCDDPEMAYKSLEGGDEAKIIVANLHDVLQSYTKEFGAVALELKGNNLDEILDVFSKVCIKCAKDNFTFHLSLPAFDLDTKKTKMNITNGTEAVKTLDLAKFNDSFVRTFMRIKCPWMQKAPEEKLARSAVNFLSAIPDEAKIMYPALNERSLDAYALTIEHCGKFVDKMYVNNRACQVYGTYLEEGEVVRIGFYGYAKKYSITTSKAEKEKANEYMGKGSIAPVYTHYIEEKGTHESHSNQQLP